MLILTLCYTVKWLFVALDVHPWWLEHLPVYSIYSAAGTHFVPGRNTRLTDAVGLEHCNKLHWCTYDAGANGLGCLVIFETWHHPTSVDMLARRFHPINHSLFNDTVTYCEAFTLPNKRVMWHGRLFQLWFVNCLCHTDIEAILPGIHCPSFHFGIDVPHVCVLGVIWQQ